MSARGRIQDWIRGRLSKGKGMRKAILVAAAGVLVAAGVASIPAVTATAGTATPGLTGVVREQQPSLNNSATAKNVTVQCPANKVVINVSGFISNGFGKVVLDNLFPNEDLTQASVSAKETDTFTGNWTVTGEVLCADPPSGVEWQTAASLDNSDSPKTASAFCSTGKTVLGTGMDIVGGTGEVDTYATVPVLDAAGRAIGMDVTAAEHDDLTTTWHVNAQVICADPVGGQQVLFADARPSTLGDSGITLYCPFGTVATGTGYDLQDALTSTSTTNGIEEAVINTIEPGGDDTTAPDRNSPYAYEEDGTSLVWTLRAYLLCAQS
jgi:hypothetical protein